MPTFTAVNSTGIKSLTPQNSITGDAGNAIDANFVLIANLIAANQTAIAAKLPLSGGTLTGALVTGHSISLAAGGLIYDSVGASFVYENASGFANLMGGAISVNFATGNMQYNGTNIAMNDGSGTGGGMFKMDNGQIEGVVQFSSGGVTHCTIDPSTGYAAFGNGGDAGAGIMINGNAGFSGSGNFTNFTIVGGIITAAS